MKSKSKATFSLKTTLVATTLIATVLGFHQTFGPVASLSAILAVIALATCWAAVQSNKEIPFFTTFAAGWLLILPTPIFYRYFDESDAIGAAFSIGIGCWLCFYSLKNGHWSTRLLAAPIFLINLIMIYHASIFAIRHPRFLFEYWFMD